MRLPRPISLTARMLATAAVISPSFGILASAAEADVIKIGLLTRLAGQSASDGQEMVNGATLAINELNAAGGIAGHTFELVVGDVKEGASSDVTAQVERLLGDPDVHFIVAGYASNTGFEIDLMKEAGMPYILSGPSGQTRDIIAANPEEYWCCWSLMPSFDAYNTDVTRLVDQLAADNKVTLGNPKKLALISSDNPYSGAIYAGMKTEAAATGWTVTVDQTVPFGEVTDWRPILAQVRSDPPDFVVNLDPLTANSATFVNQFMEDPTNSLMFLQYAPSVPEFLDLTKASSTGVLYNLMGGAISSPSYEPAAKLAKAFKDTYGVESGAYGFALYEQIKVYADALAKVQDPTDHKAIGLAIGQTDKIVAQGRLVFDPATHLAKDGADYFPIQFFQIWEGERVLVSPPQFATGEFRLPPWIK